MITPLSRAFTWSTWNSGRENKASLALFFEVASLHAAPLPNRHPANPPTETVRERLAAASSEALRVVAQALLI
jgi:hypothetical protein